MPDITSPALAALIHASDLRLVLAITGGGSRAIADLLEVPGGSQTLLEAVVPYSAASMRHWLHAAPEHYCSNRTARAMAMAGYLRAQSLSAAGGSPPSPGRLTGIGCTASLASDRPKRGAHRIHVAWQTAATTATYSIELIKGRRTRAEEERLAAALILNAIGEAGDIAERLALENLPDEPLETTRTDASPACQDLFSGRATAVRHAPGEPAAFAGQIPAPAEGRRLVFPGAFNPLHEGHRAMAQVAAEMLGLPVEFELSIENVEKPPLDFFEIEQRCGQFSQRQTVWLTRAPTFDRKAAAFENATFIVGADTIRRIAEPIYYGGDSLAVVAAIERIAVAGGRFLVFGRVNQGAFETLQECNLPDCLRRISTAVPAARFRSDISSTALRRMPSN